MWYEIMFGGESSYDPDWMGNEEDNKQPRTDADRNDDDTICQRDVLKEYKPIKESDLHRLSCTKKTNPYHTKFAPMKLYIVKEVRELQKRLQKEKGDQERYLIEHADEIAAEKKKNTKEKAQQREAEAREFVFRALVAHQQQDLQVCGLFPEHVWTRIFSFAGDAALPRLPCEDSIAWNTLVSDPLNKKVKGSVWADALKALGLPHTGSKNIQMQRLFREFCLSHSTTLPARLVWKARLVKSDAAISSPFPSSSHSNANSKKTKSKSKSPRNGSSSGPAGPSPKKIKLEKEYQ